MAKRKNRVQSSGTAAAVLGDQWGPARQIAWVSMLALIFLTPIALSNLTFLGFQLPITYDQFDIIKVFFQRVFTFIALAAWAWDIGLNGGKIRRTPVEWLLIAFLAWVSVSTVLSIHPATAFFGKYRRFEGLYSMLNYAAIYFLIMQLADTPARIKRVAQTLFWAGIVVSGYGVAQALGLDMLKWGQLPFEANRSFSTYGNPDLLAGFLMFATFVSLGLVFAERNLVWRGVYWAGFLINAICIVTAFTRSAWVGSVVGFTLFAILAIRQRTPWFKEDWAFSALTVLPVIGFVVKSLSNPNEVMNFGKRVGSIFKFGEGSAKTRFEIWDAAFGAIKDRPVFGFGPDTFRLLFPKYKPIEYVKDAGYLSVADNVHNYPLQLATGIGIPGVAMFYGLMGWAAARSFKLVWTKDGQASRMILVGFWVGCAAYLTHLFFGLSVTGASFLLWVALAIVLSPTATTVEVPRFSWGVAVAAVVSLLAVAGVVSMIVYMQADNAYLKARIYAQGPERTAFARKAVKLNPDNDMYRAEIGLALSDETIAIVNQMASAPDQAAAQQQLKAKFLEAEASLKETIAYVPAEYDNYVFLANLYNLAGQFIDPSYFTQAISTAQAGIAVEQYGPAIRIQLARAYDLTGQPDLALKEFKFAHDMDPAYTDAAIGLAEAYAKKGQYSLAVKALKETDAVSPGTVADTLSKMQSLEASQK